MPGHMVQPDRELFKTGKEPCRSADSSTRERILRTAAAHFAFRGYAGTSIDEIVDTAKTSKSTLYHHFQSKKLLYATLLDETMNALCAALAPPAAEPACVKARVRALFQRADCFLRSHPSEMRMLNVHCYGAPSGTPIRRLTYHRILIESTVAGLLQPAVAEGKIRKEDLGSVVLFVVLLLREMQLAADRSTSISEPDIEPYLRALDILLEKRAL